MTEAPIPLPGMPEPDGVVVLDDYDEWIKTCWPHYVAAANSGEPFTISQIAKDRDLPDPPRAQAQWGQLPKLLVKAGLIRGHNQTANSVRTTVHSSLVHMWIGIPADQRAEAAA